MLKLRRREGEAIVVNENITFRIFVVDGKEVTVGIEAPKEIPVLREELLKRGKKNVQEQK